MGACDGPRRLEPVAPAVGDRPSIGDEGRPRQSERRRRIYGDGGEHRAPSVMPILGSILPDSCAPAPRLATISNQRATYSPYWLGTSVVASLLRPRLPLLPLLFVLAGTGGACQPAAAPGLRPGNAKRSPGQAFGVAQSGLLTARALGL